MNISVFLDQVFPFNGALTLVPGSQKHGNLQAGHDKQKTNYPLWTLDNATVEKLVDEGGIVAPAGKRSGMLMFHGNLAHGSAGTITPFSHRIVYLTLNAVSNHIRKPTRAAWIAHQDFAPIVPGPDDELLRFARSRKARPQAAEWSQPGAVMPELRRPALVSCGPLCCSPANAFHRQQRSSR